MWSFEHVSGTWQLQRILKTFVRDYQHDAVLIRVADEESTSTQLHPYWIVSGVDLAERPRREHWTPEPENSSISGRWVDACDVRVGDVVLLRDGRQVSVESVRLIPGGFPVYNFAVDDLHCYAVGNAQVLVHNQNGLEADPPPRRGGYQPPPREITGIQGLTSAKAKTPVQGGGGLRKRWKDGDGNIYEWDSQHGTLEKYSPKGNHLGEFNPNTGGMTKPADPSRNIKRFL